MHQIDTFNLTDDKYCYLPVWVLNTTQNKKLLRMAACKLLIKQLIQQYSLFLRIDTASKNMLLWYSSVIDVLLYPLFTGLQPVSHKKGSNIRKEE